jgi:hypothetical protein
MNIYMAIVCLSSIVAIIGLLADSMVKTGKKLGELIAIIFLLIIGIIIAIFSVFIHKAFNTKFVNALDFHKERASTADEIVEDIMNETMNVAKSLNNEGPKTNQNMDFKPHGGNDEISEYERYKNKCLIILQNTNDKFYAYDTIDGIYKALLFSSLPVITSSQKEIIDEIYKNYLEMKSW